MCFFKKFARSKKVGAILFFLQTTFLIRLYPNLLALFHAFLSFREKFDFFEDKRKSSLQSFYTIKTSLQFFQNETFEKDNLCLTKSTNKLLCTWKATKDCSHSYWKTSVVFWHPKMSVFFWLFPWKNLKGFPRKNQKNTDILGCQKKLMIFPWENTFENNFFKHCFTEAEFPLVWYNPFLFFESSFPRRQKLWLNLKWTRTFLGKVEFSLINSYVGASEQKVTAFWQNFPGGSAPIPPYSFGFYLVSISRLSLL